MSRAPLFCFIDPLVSGIYLCDSLKSRGIRFVFVRSRDMPSDYAALPPEVPTYTLKGIRDVHQLVSQLKSIGVTHVFYGAGPTASLADYLAQELSPAFANSLSNTSFRSHKYDMQVALQRAGLPTMKQHLFDPFHCNTQVLVDAVGFPSVMKPAVAAGSVGVSIINNQYDLQTALAEVPTSNQFSSNQQYVLQEQLQGTEYVIDAVSLQGQHQIVGIFRYEKDLVEGHPLYRSTESLQPTSPEWRILKDYTIAVLSATGLNNGLSHTEVFLTPQGPRLVELNPRISGAYGLLNQMSYLSYGTTQPDVLIHLAMDLPLPEPRFQGMTKLMCLRTHSPRKIKALNNERLYQLPSVVNHKMLKTAGSMVDSSQNLWGLVGFVLLFNLDPVQLAQDYTHLLRLERDEVLF